VSNQKTLILLGSTGFLGNAIVDSMKLDGVADVNTLLVQSSITGDTLNLYQLDSSDEVRETFEFSQLRNTFGSELVVLNCASSRHSKDEDRSKLANYLYPKKVLEKLLTTDHIRIKWIQTETFWQYSSSSIPDSRYIFWKNQFGQFLSESVVAENLIVEKIVLPHLIGPGDKVFRFLPQLFSTIMKGEDLQVTCPEEVFCLADVRDVASYLVYCLKSDWPKHNISTALFPFVEIQLQEIIGRFTEISESTGQVHFRPCVEASNPALILEEQPKILSSSTAPLRSIQTTFSEIAKWLSEVQAIDNLK